MKPYYEGGIPPEGTKTIDLPGNQKLYERDNEPIPMTEDMTKRLWALINENTELKQQLYFAEHRLEQIKRLLREE
jgi:hypothetical protein